MKRNKPMDRPNAPPSIAPARRDMLKIAVSLVALSWASPALAGLDFDALFADYASSEPWRASYLILCICESVYGDNATRAKRWGQLGLSDSGTMRSPETGAEVHILKTNKHLFVAFRGTKGWKDMVVDASMSKVEAAFGSFNIHSGFAGQGMALRDFVKKAVTDGLGDRKLWFIGHSLGGALAELLAYDVQVNLKVPVAGVVTCGAPKVGGDPWKNSYDGALKNKTRRWINQHDPVPHLPKGDGWSQVGHKNVIRKKGVHFDAGDTPDAGDPGDHRVPEYLHGLRKHMPDGEKKGLPNVKDIEVLS